MNKYSVNYNHLKKYFLKNIKNDIYIYINYFKKILELLIIKKINYVKNYV